MEAARGGVDEEVDIRLVQQFLIIIVDGTAEFVDGVLAPFGKLIRNGHDLKLFRLVLEAVRMNAVPAAAEQVMRLLLA